MDVPYRDELFQLESPFTGQPLSLMKMRNRFAGIRWGNDRYAVVSDNWWNTRNTRMYLFDPSNPQREPSVIDDRNYQDVYSDPGILQSEKNEMGTYTLKIDGETAYLFGDGFSAEGQFPFIDALNLKTLEKKRIYQSAAKGEVEIWFPLSTAKPVRWLPALNPPTEYPNYYIRNISKRIANIPLTTFVILFNASKEFTRR